MWRKYWGRAVVPAIVMTITATLTASCGVTSGHAASGSSATAGLSAPTGDDAALPATIHDIASRWGPRIVDLLRTVAEALQRSQGSR